MTLLTPRGAGALAALLALAACSDPPPAAPVPDARTAASPLPPDTTVVRGIARATARIEPVGRGRATGTVRLIQTVGGVRVLVRLDGLSASGYHALQILRGRDCAADPDVHLGVDAGTPHGSPYAAPAYRHAGDLGNVRGDDGEGRYDRIDAVLELNGSTSPVGRAVVVRALPDDAASPGGGGGDVLGCGLFHPGR